MDSEMDGFATGLTTAICKDGQTTATARIPFAVGLQLAVGSVGAPAVNFTADTNTGMYSPGTGLIGLASGGTERLRVVAGGVQIIGTLTTTGTYTVSGQLLIGSGSVGAPGMAFATDSDTGIFQGVADRLAISCGGGAVITCLTTGVQMLGTLTLSSDFAINTNKFTVAGASGNTVVAGTLGVTGVTTHSANVTVTTGGLTVSAGGASVTGNSSVTGTLSVSGAATLGAGSTMGGQPITNFPAGTQMLFQNIAAPTGWTRITAHNNKALRLVDGNSGVSSGGSAAFTSAFASRTIAQTNIPNYNLSLAGISITITDPGHAHTGTFYLSGSGASPQAGTNGSAGSSGVASNTTGITAALSGGSTLASGGSGTAMDFAVAYVDVILASKD
jgi:hypothetical protein